MCRDKEKEKRIFDNLMCIYYIIIKKIYDKKNDCCNGY
jgi:hypothetical protein